MRLTASKVRKRQEEAERLEREKLARQQALAQQNPSGVVNVEVGTSTAVEGTDIVQDVNENLDNLILNEQKEIAQEPSVAPLQSVEVLTEAVVPTKDTSLKDVVAAAKTAKETQVRLRSTRESAKDKGPSKGKDTRNPPPSNPPPRTHALKRDGHKRKEREVHAVEASPKRGRHESMSSGSRESGRIPVHREERAVSVGPSPSPGPVRFPPTLSSFPPPTTFVPPVDRRTFLNAIPTDDWQYVEEMPAAVRQEEMLQMAIQQSRVSNLMFMMAGQQWDIFSGNQAISDLQNKNRLITDLKEDLRSADGKVQLLESKLKTVDVQLQTAREDAKAGSLIIAKRDKEISELKGKLEETKKKYETEVKAGRKKYEDAVASEKKKCDDKLAAERKKHEEELIAERGRYEEEIHSLQETNNEFKISLAKFVKAYDTYGDPEVLANQLMKKDEEIANQLRDKDEEMLDETARFMKLVTSRLAEQIELTHPGYKIDVSKIDPLSKVVDGQIVPDEDDEDEISNQVLDNADEFSAKVVDLTPEIILPVQQVQSQTEDNPPRAEKTVEEPTQDVNADNRDSPAEDKVDNDSVTNPPVQDI